MKVLVAGYGYVGQAAARFFTQKGHEVWGVRRYHQGNDPSVHLLSADLSREPLPREMPGGVDLILCALSPGERSDEAYRLAYPKTVSNLLRRYPTARMVLVSSTTVYAQGHGVKIDESSLADSAHFSAVRIRESEDLLLDGSIRHAVLRTSGIYGPGRTKLVSRLLESEVEPNVRDVSTCRIHRDDLARAILFVAESETSSGIYLASDPNPATLADMRQWLVRQDLPSETRLARKISSSPRKRKDRRILPRRLLAEGFSFLYPSFREGYSSIFANE